MDILVFDTGPLAHFARAGWLGVLKTLVGSRRAIIPVQVSLELRQASGHEQAVGTVLDATWIELHELNTEEELRVFARFAAYLMSEGRNEGETAVLAVAATMPAQAVLDDSAGYRAAQREGVRCIRTLALLCESIRNGLLTAELVSAVADDLIETDYRLPFKPGEFIPWAIAESRHHTQNHTSM
ncbi:MAG: nucleotide-binding protein [Acidimicrobiaceae bacterium]|nr:nucleotide-binding protein [Acidimicrobiaceae bacterium]